MSVKHFGTWRLGLFIGLISALAVFSAGRCCLAQQAKPYYVWQIKQELQEGEQGNKNLAQVKNRVIGGSASFSDPQVRAQLDQWYLGYFFPSFTQPDQLHKLPLKRKELVDDLTRTGGKASTQEVYKYLRDNTEKYMNGFATTTRVSFHPAVRFNAMLMVGDLNAAEKSMTASRRIPQPLDRMLKVLYDELSKANQSDAIKVAAIIGILRHSKLQWYEKNTPFSVGKRDAIATQMLAIVNAPEPPPGRSASGHAWMQRRALEVLAALKVIGEVDAVNNAISRIVGDPNSDLAVRCTAARSLALISSSGNARLDSTDASLKLGALAAQSVRADLAWIDDMQLKKELKKLAQDLTGSILTPSSGGGGGMGMGSGGDGGMVGAEEEDMGGGDEDMMGDMGDMGDMGGMDMGGMGGGFAAPKDPELDLARRRLKYKLVCVKEGLSGVANASPQEDPQVTRVADLVDEVLDATDPPEDEPTLDALARELRKKVRELELLTKSVVPATGDQPEEAPISEVPVGVSEAPPAAATATSTKGG